MGHTRRSFICGSLACTAGVLHAHKVLSQATDELAETDESFVCSTDESLIEQGLDIQDFGSGDTSIEIDTTVREFSITDYGTSMLSQRWRPADAPTPGSKMITLGCSFLTGSPQDRKLVEKAARGWLQGGVEKLIQFDFSVPQERAHIRIFIGPGGNNSHIGRNARRVPRDKPTMNLATLKPGTIQHEFGHALGLLHEHLNPGFAVQLNEPEILAEMAGPPNRWSEATTRLNILNRFGTEARCVTDPGFNPELIMMYNFPGRWTADGNAFVRARKDPPPRSGLRQGCLFVMRACLRLRFALLAILLAAGLSAEAQTLENKRPIVFIWAEDSQTMRRQPLGSGFVLNAQGDVLDGQTRCREGRRRAASGRVDLDQIGLFRPRRHDRSGLRADAGLLPDPGAAGCRSGPRHVGVLPAWVLCSRKRRALDGCRLLWWCGSQAGVVTPRGSVIGGMITGRLLPTSIPLEPGMSGGPVFDSTMTVIGLVKGGTTGGQFGYVQLLQPARSMLADRGMDCRCARRIGGRAAVAAFGEVAGSVRRRRAA